ncbi:hypothetical protein [Escherichia coli]|uniref:hypothetical protein n=1 Tax=Escherichia coli TaxID=562 RepID=UPI0013E0D969|nr:hypothetical protein [Escherichia coli]
MAKSSYLVQEANISPDSVVQFSVNDIACWDGIKLKPIQIFSERKVYLQNISGTPFQWEPGDQYLGYARPRNIAFNYIVRVHDEQENHDYSGAE